MHERRYQNDINGLRNSERIERLDLEKISNFALIDLPNMDSLLDIGTGSGLFAEKFSSLNIQVTGLDVNPEMIRAAMQYLPNVNFQIGIAEKLPFHDNAFDLVFMGFLLHETDNHIAAMNEAYRVARFRLTVLEWPDKDQTNGPPSHHRLSHNQIVKFADQAGFLNFKKNILNSAVLYNFDK